MNNQTSELEKVQSVLDRVRRKWHAVRVLGGLSLCFSVVLGVAIAAVTLAMFLPLSPAMRWGLRALFVASAFISIALFVIKRIVENPTDEDIALLIETAHPQLNNELINAIRFSESPQKQSPVFLRAAIKESARKAIDLDTSRVVSWRACRKRAWSLLCVLLLWAVLAIIFPARCANAIARLIHPSGNIAQVGNAKILEVAPGNVTVVAGENLDITVKVEFLLNATSEIILQHAITDGPRREESMTPIGENVYRCTLLDIESSRTYRVAVGGSLSQKFTIDVTERPIVQSIGADYIFPSYTKTEPLSVADCGGIVRAVKGTQVGLRFTANKRLLKANFAGATDGKSSAFFLQPGKVSGVLRNAIQISQNGSGYIKIEDEFDCHNSRVVQVIAVADGLPKVKIESPGSDRTLSAGDTLELVIRGSDDFGILKAELIERRINPATGIVTEPKSIKMWTKFSDAKTCAINWRWKFAEDVYNNGEIVRYFVKMTDGNDVTEPGVGVSGEFVVRLEDVSAQKKARAKKYSSWQADLEKVLKEQRELRRVSGE